MPIVSIGLPVYNAENFIRDAIESILAQTFEDFELIISDNASTDSTEDICREYATKDQRIQYYRNEKNIGALRNFNQTFHISKGRYFKWASHDDICAPTFISECANVLDCDTSIVNCYPKTQLIDENGNESSVTYNPLKETGSSDPYKRYRDILLNDVFSFPVFGLIRRNVMAKSGLLRQFYGSDKVLLGELSLLGRFHEINKPLFLRRCWPKQSSQLTVKEKRFWTDPHGKRWLPFQIYSLYYYAILPRKAPIKIKQELKCYGSVIRLCFKAEKWRKLFIPGKYNYFGIDFGGDNAKGN